VTGVVFGDMKGCTPTFHDDYRWRTSCSRRSRGSTCRWRSGCRAGTRPTPNLTLPLGVRARLECYGTEARFSVLEAPVE